MSISLLYINLRICFSIMYEIDQLKNIYVCKVHTYSKRSGNHSHGSGLSGDNAIQADFYFHHRPNVNCTVGNFLCPNEI